MSTNLEKTTKGPGAMPRAGLPLRWLFGLLFLVAACDSETDTSGEYERPPETGDGWVTASPDAVGMDAVGEEDHK